MKKNLIYLIVFLFSCTNLENKSSLNLDNSNCQSISINKLFKNWSLIELDYLINKVDDFLIWDNKIFILDRQLESIKIFNWEGRLIKIVEGDVFQNGKHIQPVAMYKSHTNEIGFYDAANESILKINRELLISDKEKSQFYISRIYTTKTGYIVFKNQSVQNNEDPQYRSNVLVLNKDFKVIDKYFDFSIEENIPRTWRFFPDPINVKNEGFEFFEPLTSQFFLFKGSSNKEIIPIEISKRALELKNLDGVDLEDPFDVLENIFKKYATINAKRLESSSLWGIRFIDDFKSNFYFHDKIKDEGICASEIYLQTEVGKLILPFPSFINESDWISILDQNNYELLNLQSYSNLNPIIDNVIKSGKTYIMILEN